MNSKSGKKTKSPVQAENRKSPRGQPDEPRYVDDPYQDEERLAEVVDAEDEAALEEELEEEAWMDPAGRKAPPAKSDPDILPKSATQSAQQARDRKKRSPRASSPAAVPKEEVRQPAADHRPGQPSARVAGGSTIRPSGADKPVEGDAAGSLVNGWSATYLGEPARRLPPRRPPRGDASPGEPPGPKKVNYWSGVVLQPDLPPFMADRYEIDDQQASGEQPGRPADRQAESPYRDRSPHRKAEQNAPFIEPRALDEPARLDLSDVVRSHQPLPGGSMIIGVCPDGRPLLVEFDQPDSGSIVILGDDKVANRRHLNSILASVELLNGPEEVHAFLVTPDPDAFAGSGDRLSAVIKPDQDDCYDLLGDLFAVLEHRARQSESGMDRMLRQLDRIKSDLLRQEVQDRPPAERKGPVHLLLIEQIDVLLSQLAPESLSFLRWLLRRGPEWNVWTVASLSPQLDSDWKTVRAFGLQLVGRINNPRLVERATQIPVPEIHRLHPGREACLKLEDEVIRFLIPSVAVQPGETDRPADGSPDLEREPG